MNKKRLLAWAAGALLPWLGGSAPLHAQTDSAKNLFPSARILRGEPKDPKLLGIRSQGALQVSSIEHRVTETFYPGASPQAADLNGDNLPDLIVADPVGYFWFYANLGPLDAPKFGPGELLPLWLNDPKKWEGSSTYLYYVPRIQLTDYNEDGMPDLVVGTFYGELFFIPLKKNDGRLRVEVGTPPWRNEIPTVPPSREGAAYWCNLMAPLYLDWDGDGKKELIVGEGSYASNHIWLIPNKGSNQAPIFDANLRKVLLSEPGQERFIPSAIDWNRDGKPDLAVATAKGQLKVYLNTPLKEVEPLLDSAAPILVSLGTTNSIGTNSCPSFADLNGDGLPDLLLGNSAGQIKWAKNIGQPGAPSFAALVSLTSSNKAPPAYSPSGWNLREHLLMPFGSLEWMSQEPATDPKRGAPGSLFFYYAEPPHASIEGSFPQVGDTVPHTLEWKNSEVTSLPLQNQRSYTLSFMVMGKGFTEVEWSLAGEKEIPASAEVKRNRRGQISKKTASSAHSDRMTLGESWAPVTKLIRIKLPDLPPNTKIDHKFTIKLTGAGEFYLDKLSLIEEAP